MGMSRSMAAIPVIRWSLAKERESIYGLEGIPPARNPPAPLLSKPQTSPLNLIPTLSLTSLRRVQQEQVTR